MTDTGVVIEYDMRAEGSGWTVYDVATGEPAIVRGVRQRELPLDDADDLVDLLNQIEAVKPGSSVTWADGSVWPA